MFRINRSFPEISEFHAKEKAVNKGGEIIKGTNHYIRISNHIQSDHLECLLKMRLLCLVPDQVDYNKW